MNPPPDSRWTILEVIRPGGHSNPAMAHVRCSCGAEKVIQLASVLTGRSRSCGCLARDTAGPRLAAALTKHGEAIGRKSRLYRIWKGMRERCRYRHHVSYHRYGGRGITVTSEWDSYTVFREWALANGYADGLTIDRIDNDGNYEPANCRWITKSENARKGNLPQQRTEAAEKMERMLG